MLTGFYTAASGMYMQQRTLNVISNNMANESTPGFRTERVISNTFEETLVRQEGGKRTELGKSALVRYVHDVPSEFDPALLEETGRPFDLAISGQGFFNVKNEAGDQFMTRNGGFDLDAEGYLILPGAGRVQGQRGDIQPKDAGFSVLSDGSVVDVKGRTLDTLLVTVPNEGTQLKKYASGLYQVDENPPATAAQLQAQANAAAGQIAGAGDVPPPLVLDGAQAPGVTNVEFPNVQQGLLEGSNVNWNREMAVMMETQRNFQSCSKILQMIDEVNQRTVNIAAQ